MTTPTNSSVQIGGLPIPKAEALTLAEAYLVSGKRGCAYPSYDHYDAAHATGPLLDSDLLAPVLLNVRQLSITTYSLLREAIPTLQGVLDEIPVDLDLAAADDEQLELLGRLFAVVDGKAIWGARGTVLSKVLHRKRPRFIPLYDACVRDVYQAMGTPRIPLDRTRTWRDFAVLYGRALRDDLRAAPDFWDEVATLGRYGAVSPLRALDIVAWSKGAGA